MKIDLISILINSDIDYEFPYQIAMAFDERFNDKFEIEFDKELNLKYINWLLSINLSHSNDEKVSNIAGPDISKRDKIITYSIFVGDFIYIDEKTTTLFFMDKFFNHINEVLLDINVSEKLLNKITDFGNVYMKDLSINYDKYLKEYEDTDDL
ncbi:hypothetical protein [Seonamhaeicola aphaedonensis]|uniref:Uncharacterized protein n=1 Tax=Seonamhaeicola aphaedonensis TaxID=1461338 RepID=A0A3D9H9J8_9FLAO|nr:hypothetical protein [Seonamhaeicola aphaedonensis]RED45626.1 hypothetical protein DFQ02_1084 [Seonamhaeicola aphaedonensis]